MNKNVKIVHIHEYNGYKIKYGDDGKFYTYDDQGDELIAHYERQGAISYIDGRITRLKKSADKAERTPRKKVDISVLYGDSYTRLGSMQQGTITRVHGGNGSVIIAGSQRGNSEIYIDTFYTQALIDTIVELDRQAKAGRDVLTKYARIAGSRVGWSARERGGTGVDGQDLEEKLVVEANKKLAEIESGVLAVDLSASTSDNEKGGA